MNTFYSFCKYKNCQLVVRWVGWHILLRRTVFEEGLCRIQNQIFLLVGLRYNQKPHLHLQSPHLLYNCATIKKNIFFRTLLHIYRERVRLVEKRKHITHSWWQYMSFQQLLQLQGLFHCLLQPHICKVQTPTKKITHIFQHILFTLVPLVIATLFFYYLICR